MNRFPIPHPENLVTVFVIQAFCLSTDQVHSCLNEEELDRARRFRREEDSKRWACYRAALKLTLASLLEVSPLDIEFRLNPSGKPELKTRFSSLHFNLSHCDDLAVIATSRLCPVGIDIERQHRAQDLHECESTICHPAEIPMLPIAQEQRAAALLELWTAKEAFLKAIGSGLSNPPEEIVIRSAGQTITAITRDGMVLPLTRLHHSLLHDHSVHLCALQPIDSIEILAGLPHAEHLRSS